MSEECKHFWQPFTGRMGMNDAMCAHCGITMSTNNALMKYEMELRKKEYEEKEG